MRAKSDRMRTASSGNSSSRGWRSTVMLLSLTFIRVAGLVSTGEHDGAAQQQQPNQCDFARICSEREAQGACDACAGHRMFADAAVGSQPGDAFLDTIVDLVQGVAQVFLGVLYLNLCF